MIVNAPPVLGKHYVKEEVVISIWGVGSGGDNTIRDYSLSNLT